MVQSIILLSLKTDAAHKGRKRESEEKREKNHFRASLYDNSRAYSDRLRHDEKGRTDSDSGFHADSRTKPFADSDTRTDADPNTYTDADAHSDTNACTSLNTDVHADPDTGAYNGGEPDT